MTAVRVLSTKWGGGAHRDSEATELGRDRHGLWLWMPDGTVVTAAKGSYPACPGLRLFPENSWWSAYFVPPYPGLNRPEQWYVDITTPAVRTAELITFVDLDLDVERLGGGQVHLLDEDEFQTNSAALKYPAEVVARAQHVAGEMLAWMESGAEPFGVVSQQWLNHPTVTSRIDPGSKNASGDRGPGG